MKTYIPRFHDQHQDIDRLIENLLLADQARDVARIRSLLKDLRDRLENHHGAERELFFEKISNDPRLNEGGPFCTYFFDFFMNNRPLQIAHRKLKALGFTEALSIPDEMQSYFSNQSPLCIPLEEHLALQFLVQGLQKTFTATETGAPVPQEAVSRALIFLQDLARRNVHKEETCLWALSQQILDASVFAELAALT